MKPILFIDFDGTLCYDKFWQSIDPGSFDQIQDFLFDKNKSLIDEWMRGIHSSEHVNQLISKELNIPFEEIWNIFSTDCEKMDVPSSILSKINDLRRNYHVILITDNMDCFDRFTVPALGLNSYFDSIINSFNSKKLKSDNGGEVFLQITGELECKIENSILMDNSETACGTFSKLGGTACLVTSEKPIAFWLESLKTN